MRRWSALLLALGTSACARHVYSAPVPATTSAAASAPSGAPMPRNSVSTGEAVDYLLSRELAIPVAGTVVSDLRDSFDEGRDGGRVHRALDIMAPRGTPVLSADSGRILRVSANALGGNIIYAIDPLGRVVYYYAHLDAYQPGLVSGMTIARGDTLGFVGTTGNAPKDTPHLHFQVMRMPPDGKYWDGDAINPFPLLLLTHVARR
jgi:murein DD-endopeptidase MepM/ murein hydrolase activator NlpD